MLTEMHGSTFVCRIEDTEELRSVSRRGACQRTRTNQSTFDGRGLDPWWMGGTKEEINEALAVGWPTGQETVEKLAEEMRSKVKAPVSFRRRQTWSEDGDEPSWEREQHGHDAIWRTAKRQQQRGPAVVQLNAPWGGHAGRDASELMWDGVVLVVLVRVLEEAGYRVGATLNYASTSTSRGPEQSLIQVEVKRPEMPLDIATLVPVACHPGVVRWHGINAISLAPFDVGMGHMRPVEIAQIGPQPAIRANGITLKHCYAEYAARAEIERVLAMFGVAE